MSALWAFISPYVAKAVQWAGWTLVFLFNAVLGLDQFRAAEIAACSLLFVVCLGHWTSFGITTAVLLAVSSAYSGYKLGKS